MKQLKNYFLAGLLVWLPIGLTIWLIKFIVQTVINLVPPNLVNLSPFGVAIPGFGIILTILILITTGIIARNILGQKFIRLWEKSILHIPIVKSIYKGIKQVSDTLLSSNGNAFRKALLVQFPNSNSYTIAFITGHPSQEIMGQELYKDYINVYVPTTPNPTSGYFLVVKKSDTRELNITVDEALRYVISMGSVDPKKS